MLVEGLPGGAVVKQHASAEDVGDPGSIPGSGRCPGEGNGNPLQYSCLENTMDRGAWQATVHGDERVRHDLATKPLSPSLVNWKKAYVLFFYFHCNELFFLLNIIL